MESSICFVVPLFDGIWVFPASLSETNYGEAGEDKSVGGIDEAFKCI